MYTDHGSLGGGEILQYWGQSGKNPIEYVDHALQASFAMIPIVKLLIYVLIVLLMIIIILRIFHVKHFTRGRGLSWEIENVNEIKSRDKWILTSNKFLSRISKFIESTPFSVPKSYRDYLQYNINRAGLHAPGGFRNLTAAEFNALIKITSGILLAIAVLVTIFVSNILGFGFIIAIIFATAMIPNIVLRAIVATKDNEIRVNFSNMYLMIHYVLLGGGATTLDKVLKSYAKTTTSEEMLRFVDNCCGHIETYGEYHAADYIARDYREIAQVGKLMRLIRQMNEGGDIEQELIGFRAELIKEHRIALEKKSDKLVNRAKTSFSILYIVLVQAIISAMAIYLPDLGIMQGSFGM